MVTPVVRRKAVALLNPNVFTSPHKSRIELATWKTTTTKSTALRGITGTRLAHAIQVHSIRNVQTNNGVGRCYS